VAEIAEEPPSARTELLMAVAGPAVSVALVAANAGDTILVHAREAIAVVGSPA